jgi:general secretion pathway protein G
LARWPADREQAMMSALNKPLSPVATVVTLSLVLVLAFVVLCPRFGRGVKPKVLAAGVDISNICSALDNFSTDYGRFPTTVEGLQALMVQPAGLSGWKGPYLEKGVPLDPFGNAYVYRCPGDHNKKTFDLWSTGPSGQDGGPDNIDNWTALGTGH